MDPPPHGCRCSYRRDWTGQDHREINVYFRRQEGGTREEGEEEKEEKKEIKLWYRGLLNEGGSILPDPRSASVRPSAPSVRPSVRPGM